MRARNLERRLARGLEFMLAAGMLSMFLIIIVLVAMRYLFQSGLVGANETATVIFVYLSSIGAAVAVGRDEHIGLDLVHRRMGRTGKRFVYVSALVLVAALNAVVAERSLTWIATTGHIPMPASQIPRFVAQSAVPLGCALAVIFCCTRIASAWSEDSE